MKIIVDAMGGDFAPLAPVKGALMAQEKYGVDIVLTGKTEEIPIPPPEIPDHHGGGDYNLVRSFVDAVLTRNTSEIVTGPEISLETHYLVFAAEIARKSGSVVNMKDFFRKTGVEGLLHHTRQNP